MPDECKSNGRRRVRAECLDTACGFIGHMTVDEIRKRLTGHRVNVSCPACGRIHLSEEDVAEAESRKINAHTRFKMLAKNALHTSEAVTRTSRERGTTAVPKDMTQGRLSAPSD
jgi:hypothetical protein